MMITCQVYGFDGICTEIGKVLMAQYASCCFFEFLLGSSASSVDLSHAKHALRCACRRVYISMYLSKLHWPPLKILL